MVKKSGRKRIGRVFRDRDELPTASSLADNIENALKDSGYLVVICSPRTLQSQWVMKEIETFSAYQAFQIKQQSDMVKKQSDKVKEQSELLKKQVQETLKGQSMYMANISNQLLAGGDRRTAVMVAREALPSDLENPDRPYVEEAEFALSQAHKKIFMGSFRGEYGYISGNTIAYTVKD